MIPDVTLVTCFFDLIKYNSKGHAVDKTMKEIKPLLETPCYLLIFADNTYFNIIKNIRDSNNLDKLTKYVIMDPENLNSFKYRDIVRKNREVFHPTKDERNCDESHLVQCAKFEMVLKGIEMNPFNTSKFGWIDANVRDNFSKICVKYTNNKLLELLNNCTDKFHIQLLASNDKNLYKTENLREYYKQYRYVVCGGLFVTGIEIGKKILTELNEIFIKTTLAGYGHGEEMFYFEILDKYYDDIVRSYGDYQYMINNFHGITEGIDYIYNYIIKGYLNRRYYKECIDCCSNLIKQYETYKIPINYDIYFGCLFDMYLAIYYHDHSKAKSHVEKIKKLVTANPYIEAVYNKNKEFFEAQFAFVN